LRYGKIGTRFNLVPKRHWNPDGTMNELTGKYAVWIVFEVLENLYKGNFKGWRTKLKFGKKMTTLGLGTFRKKNRESFNFIEPRIFIQNSMVCLRILGKPFLAQKWKKAPNRLQKKKKKATFWKKGKLKKKSFEKFFFGTLEKRFLENTY